MFLVMNISVEIIISITAVSFNYILTCAGYGCFLLLHIWWWGARKGSHGSSKRKRLEGKIYKTWSSYTSWSNQDQWQMSPYSFRGNISCYSSIAFNDAWTWTYICVNQPKPSNISLSMHCVCHGLKEKTIALYVCLVYHHLPISGENPYGSNVDNFFLWRFS